MSNKMSLPSSIHFFKNDLGILYLCLCKHNQNQSIHFQSKICGNLDWGYLEHIYQLERVLTLLSYLVSQSRIQEHRISFYLGLLQYLPIMFHKFLYTGCANHFVDMFQVLPLFDAILNTNFDICCFHFLTIFNLYLLIFFLWNNLVPSNLVKCSSQCQYFIYTFFWIF